MQNKPKIIVQAILLFAMAALFAVVPILSLQQEEITDLTTITATEIDNYLTFSPRLKQGDSCINHHCTATEVVASYTMSDRRYFPCVPRYGMY